MTTYDIINNIFTQDTLKKLFPEDLTDRFFDALFGDVTEGAYDISLEFRECSQNRLEFEFHLRQRPGKCLACHLTTGLPTVFSRHPIINIKGLVREIDQLLKGQAECSEWKLGPTRQVSNELHTVPLTIFLDK
ncbi:pancreas/duodenum homeobox protein 1 [Desulfobacterales bacterium HSG2]|nr:pancreas/duodenum homeobox protein 1 [Desulfobacterales bacterium HSG2]